MSSYLFKQQSITALATLLLPLAILFVIPTVSSTGDVQDLSSYGFDYSWDQQNGWFFLAPDVDDFSTFLMENVPTLEECAAICQEREATAGGYYRLISTCYCHEKVVCYEPCIGEFGTEFSTRPMTDFPTCDKSYCHPDNFGDIFPNYCDVVNFDETECNNKIAQQGGRISEDFSPYGYDNTWSSAANGFMFQLPQPDGTNPETGFPTTTAGLCAEACGGQGAVGGSWSAGDGFCFCHLDFGCREPCIEDTGVDFATLAVDAIDICDLSYCDVDYYYLVHTEYCDVFANLNLEKCPEYTPSASPTMLPTLSMQPTMAPVDSGTGPGSMPSEMAPPSDAGPGSMPSNMMPNGMPIAAPSMDNNMMMPNPSMPSNNMPSASNPTTGGDINNPAMPSVMSPTMDNPAMDPAASPAMDPTMEMSPMEMPMESMSDVPSMMPSMMPSMNANNDAQPNQSRSSGVSTYKGNHNIMLLGLLFVLVQVFWMM